MSTFVHRRYFELWWLIHWTDSLTTMHFSCGKNPWIPKYLVFWSFQELIPHFKLCYMQFSSYCLCSCCPLSRNRNVVRQCDLSYESQVRYMLPSFLFRPCVCVEQNLLTFVRKMMGDGRAVSRMLFYPEGFAFEETRHRSTFTFGNSLLVTLESYKQCTLLFP